ncbi:MAG: hypothetical protein CMA44_03450 [Euryarchaeota archaeon]|jgi:hypothetical protein|nr:hypothetical protein [Euryarchaeota archaeon]|tara:strand:- start:2691 stop:3242 length:552 start_codon:yes stop_codon:yes gene_type:complete
MQPLVLTNDGSNVTSVTQPPSNPQVPITVSQNPIAMTIGMVCFLLVLPAMIVALFEFINQDEYLYYMEGTFGSLVYSTTIITILLLSGGYLTGLIRSNVQKMTCGGILIGISSLNLLLRIFYLLDYHSEMSQYFDESLFEMMFWPMHHEQLELAFLGIIIGGLMMNSSHNQEQPLATTSPIFQ